MKKLKMFPKVVLRIETQENSYTIASTPATAVTRISQNSGLVELDGVLKMILSHTLIFQMKKVKSRKTKSLALGHVP